MVSSADLEADEVWMVFWSFMHILTLFLDFFLILGVKNDDKDLKIIVLRQQVWILQHKAQTTARISTPERMILVILIDKFKQSTDDA